jgi:hypothetical protein
MARLAMDYLKYHPGLRWPTLLRSQGVRPATVFYPLGRRRHTPMVAASWWKRLSIFQCDLVDEEFEGAEEETS